MARAASIFYYFEITAITLNISTGHLTMSGKKLSYVRRKLLVMLKAVTDALKLKSIR